MEELNLKSGGRPIYLDDFQVLQNCINTLQTTLSAGADNCVIAGCKYTETANTDGTYTVNVTEGYVLLDGKLRHVEAYTNKSLNMTGEYPLNIVPVDKYSTQKAKYKNLDTEPLTKLYEADIVVYSGSELTTPHITLAYKENDTDDHNTRFTAFHDVYAGFTRKADVKSVESKSELVDLKDYQTIGDTLPTIDAVFVYGQYLTHHRTINIPQSSESKYAGLTKGLYYAFCVKHDYTTDDTGVGTTYMLYDYQYRLAAIYDSSTVPTFVLESFGDAIVTLYRNGLMSKEMLSQFNEVITKLNKIDIDTIASTENTYTQDETNSLLSNKADNTTVAKKQDILWGEIKMWCGSSMPDNYHLCDGSTFAIPSTEKDNYWDLYQAIGTTFNSATTPSNTFALPDLSGRFVLGQGKGFDGTNYTLGSADGEYEVTLETKNLPAHDHKFCGDDNLETVVDKWEGSVYQSDAISYDASSTSSGEKGNVYTTSKTGNGVAHNNMPPYFVLAYIIRIK